jgi:hypothetical protein
MKTTKKESVNYNNVMINGVVSWKIRFVEMLVLLSIILVLLYGADNIPFVRYMNIFMFFVLPFAYSRDFSKETKRINGILGGNNIFEPREISNFLSKFLGNTKNKNKLGKIFLFFRLSLLLGMLYLEHWLLSIYFISMFSMFLSVFINDIEKIRKDCLKSKMLKV